MNYSKKIKDLIIELYPSRSLYSSCKKCAEVLGYSHETIYKSCRDKNYIGRKRLFLLLTLKGKEKGWEKKEKYNKKIIKYFKNIKHNIDFLIQRL